MATETPKPVGKILGNTLDDIYTCPAGKKATVQTAQLSNTSTTTAIAGTVVWSDASAATEYTMLPGVSVQPSAGQSALSGPMYLDEGDKIRAMAGVAGAVHLILAVVEVG